MQSKALGTLLVTLGVAAVSSAQVAFQVAGPQNGATVRETVKIRIPRQALEGVKYLSLGVDGKFRAGVMVPTQGQAVNTDFIVTDKAGMMVTLLWNTKAKVRDTEKDVILDGVDDGPHTLELIAYDAGNKKLGKQTLTLTVNNRGDLRMPSDGITLAYRFAVGEQVQYKQRTDLEYVNDVKVPTNTVMGQRRSGYSSQGRGMGGGGTMGGMAGGPGGMMGGDGEGMGGGPGMGRGGRGMMGGSGGPGGMSQGGMMGGPGGMPGGMGQGGMMGGDGGMGGMMGGGGASPFGNGDVAGPYRIPVQTVKANYIRTTEDRLAASDFFIRDRVQDGTIISAGGSARLQDIYDFKSRYRSVNSSGKVLDPGIANGARPGAYVALPMIELGGKRRVGQKWTTRAPLLLEWATLDTPTMVTVDNTLEGLEWESGYQCAKIHQTFTQRANVQIFGGAGKIEKAKVKMDRTIWFSYKAGKIIKTETITEVEGDAPSDILGAMVPQAGVGGGMGGMMGGDGEGMGGMMSGPGGMGGGKSMPGAAGMGSMGGGRPGGPGGMGGGDGAGFGGMQSGQQMESPKVPAKFRSTTVVELVVPAPVVKTAAATIKK
ncbi:hypothetical protein [Armatimonas sp.]|uniref:hypothetical protein n=1 Tax=Armatimonas sp. TaxID=1872638 RepID=UPI00286CED73|nr:hypothetical protein [Armatimonas sp.]